LSHFLININKSLLANVSESIRTEKLSLMLYLEKLSLFKVDYKKKSLNKFNTSESYEEIDTRLASGWYVNTLGNHKKKKYKTKEVLYKISKKTD